MCRSRRGYCPLVDPPQRAEVRTDTAHAPYPCALRRVGEDRLMGNNLASIDTWQNRILSFALLMLVLCLWEAAIFYFEVPKFVLPPPSAIALGLWRGFLSGVF